MGQEQKIASEKKGCCKRLWFPVARRVEPYRLFIGYQANPHNKVIDVYTILGVAGRIVMF